LLPGQWPPLLRCWPACIGASLLKISHDARAVWRSGL
jgi:hypothetical protein